MLEHVPLGAWIQARPAWVDIMLRTILYALGKAFENLRAANSADQSGFLLLQNDYDSFVAHATLTQVAEHPIDTQYYMVHGDLVGTLLLAFILLLYRLSQACWSAVSKEGLSKLSGHRPAFDRTG